MGDNMKTIEKIVGVALLILCIASGSALLKTDMVFFRWVMGLALGYVLSRSFFGFAGSINRAYRTGSTKLMRALMLMFVLSSILSASFLIFGDPTKYDLWVNPINAGLVIGGVLFGFGMSCSSCCATGTLTDLVTGLPRALITLLFFGIGVFVGFPIQAKADWVKKSLVSTATFPSGVFIPDWFGGNKRIEYIGAIAVTMVFAGIVIALSYLYEKKRKQSNTYTGVDTETVQEKLSDLDSARYKLLSGATYDRIFVKPWTLVEGAVILSVLFTLLMGVTKEGWGASTPFGFWFGRLLRVFGVSTDAITSFTNKPAGPFTMPFVENPMNMQNIGIVVGTLIYLLMAGMFTKVFTSGLKITPLDALVYALGGFAMGFGTRLSNGCNVGALYTPIANFSLSGWIFLIALVAGGMLGNAILKNVYRACVKK